MLGIKRWGKGPHRDLKGETLKIHSLLTKARKKGGEVTRREVYARALKSPVRTGTVMYESFSGNGALCNPEAVFHYLTARSEYTHLKHIWVLKKNTPGYDELVKRLQARGDVEIVEYRSLKYWSALATSQYLLNNATFPWEFTKRPDQVYANLWHGTPLKLMGYDVENGGPDTRNIVRNFVAADYLVAANERMSDMYLRAYKMNNIYQGALLETGYPRTDRQKLDASDEEELSALLAAAGIERDGRKLVVFAPTWKGRSFYSPAQDGEELLATAERLEELLGFGEHQVVLKVHQTLAVHASKLEAAKGRLVPHTVPTNALLGGADALVTDYSSIYFDYLATGRPIGFYIPDLESYASARGIYDSPGELPGPLSTDLGTLAADLVTMLHGDSQEATHWQNVRAEAARTFTPFEDGDSTERFVKVVFDGAGDVPGVRRGFSDGRESILLYLGGMASNGITSSALNLLRNIDHERFDVSVLYSHSGMQDKKKNERLIDSNVRLFSRQGTVNATMRERAKYESQNMEGLPPRGSARHDLDWLWEREARRCFGNAHFDHAVDFSGYSPFWSRIILASQSERKSVWLHNDLLADARRTVNGKQAHKANLESMFSLYRDYDSLVSVSEALSKVNEENLGEYAPNERFTSAVNTIDGERILSMAGEIEVELLEGQEAPVLKGEKLQDDLAALVAAYGTRTVRQCVNRANDLHKFGLDEHSSGPVFVSVGRLSPEKNHERLIRSFAIVLESHPDARLLILGGGPLKSHLQRVISELELSDNVMMPGPVDNPFILMDHSDYFVMSSDYEGQPMVILEARTLGLPVITTAFGSVDSAVPHGTGVVVERSVEALADGMTKALDDGLQAYAFDPTDYNRRAMGEFYAAIGAPAPLQEPDGRALSTW